MLFNKILIANRGEIAIRVARACRELGISPIGVYSDADRTSLHLNFMDNAYFIGDSSPQASYLNYPRIIEVARKAGIDAIHPGYGFLAENAQFAQACSDVHITFIGPSARALALVGDKIASRTTVKAVDVPIIPGMEVPGKDLKAFKAVAQQVGYPVIVKASMGGGGKGMRIVRSEAELESSIAAGQREAQGAFGDATVYLEKYIEKPHHIEFQVLRDTKGNVIHLFERECSIQRRHQKIIEETPSPILTDELRAVMGEAAKKVIAAAEYVNAGTVEFLMDDARTFYFLEVNARIQVEHPITEAVTGIDLVNQQIRIAAGEALAFDQESVRQHGHAIEARVYAEDPENSFFPSPGKIRGLREPQGPGVRVDSGIFEGWDVPPHYDPILSKLITWAGDRPQCVARMTAALSEYIILGIKTNIGFLRRIMNTSSFRKGEYHTHFIDEHVTELMPRYQHVHAALIAAALFSPSGAFRAQGVSSTEGPVSTPWQELGRWEICGT
jgi:acetyl-CoA carboxylase biotin carboxylase subunit